MKEAEVLRLTGGCVARCGVFTIGKPISASCMSVTPVTCGALTAISPSDSASASNAESNRLFAARSMHVDSAFQGCCLRIDIGRCRLERGEDRKSRQVGRYSLAEMP